MKTKIYTRTILRTFVMLAVCLGAHGCVVLEYRKGLVLGEEIDGKVKYPSDFVSLKHPPLLVQIGDSPAGETIFWGPAYPPVPVIPWPPGIYGLLAHKSKREFPNSRVKIAVTFRRHYSNGTASITYVLFYPQRMNISTGDRRLFPISANCKCGEGNHCETLGDGAFSMVLHPVPGVDTLQFMPSCVAEYELVTSELLDATLHIDQLEFMGEKASTNLRIRRGPTLRFEVLGP